jgi:hypothetical protein
MMMETLILLSAINPAAPDGAPPRRINDGNLQNPPCPAVPRRGPEAGDPRNIMDFHASGANSRSCAFQQSREMINSESRYATLQKKENG